MLYYVFNSLRRESELLVLVPFQFEGLWQLMPRFGTQFVDSNFNLGSNHSDFIAPQDVATYGGLCALASFDRAEPKVKSNAVIFNVKCWKFLLALFSWIETK